MIYFIVTKRNHQTISTYIGLVETYFLTKIKIIFYDKLQANLPEILSGVLIFSDIELLEDTERKKLSVIYDNLSKKQNLKILNHPANSMRRYELLKTLNENGINQFRVYRLNDDLSRIQFPAFLRFENDHSGKQSELVNSRKELELSIKSIKEPNNVGRIISFKRLTDDEDLLITEFCDTGDEKGVIKKFSAFFIDGTVIPRHVFFGVSWCLKYAEIKNETFLNEELEYIRGNPHSNQIKTIFDLAKIDFGRIDYGLKNGEIQVWEINTNPTILKQAMLNKRSLRYEVHQIFKTNLKKCLINLNNINSLGSRRKTIKLGWDVLAIYKNLLIRFVLRSIARFLRKIVRKTDSLLLAGLYSNLQSFFRNSSIKS